VLSPDELVELRSIDTATICNAIEAFHVRDDASGFMGTEIRSLTPELGVMVGYAVTATGDSTTPGVPRRGDGQVRLWEALAAAPKPAVLVFKDVSPRRSHSVLLGDVMATIATRLGAIGAVSDAAFRDLEGIRPLRFHLFAPGVAPSHGTFNILDVGVPVEVDGVRIRPGDLLHGDANGVTTVPLEVAGRLYGECLKVRQREAALREWVQSRDFTLDGLRQRILASKRDQSH
jgi:regulator of RNase E activity RraA